MFGQIKRIFLLKYFSKLDICSFDSMEPNRNVERTFDAVGVPIE